ncbi:lanthionine synthetase LanC family protein [Ekhidna sp.]
MLNQDKYLTEAIRIGDSLLEDAIIKGDKCWWQTMEAPSGGNGEILWKETENLYSGVSGIAYFLIELHRVTRDKRYYDSLIKTANWLEWYCDQNETDYYAFYTGRLGVAFLFLSLAEHLENDDYVHKALKIAEKADKFLQREDLVCDLINGVSGSLLALIHIHQKTKSDRILHSIRKFTDYLIAHCQFAEYGIYWDRSPKNIRGLCGFSHGAAGIGYVFLELSQYFQNPTFQWIAQQAFSYENHHYNIENNNWPDFRRGFYTEVTYKQHVDAYLNGNKDFFLENRYMSAWCHGAPGIGLSRIRASEILEKGFLKDLNQALDQTKKSDVDKQQEYVSYTLCHGLCGNAFLFLEAHRILPEEKYLKWSKKIGDYAIDFFKKHTTYISGYSQGGLQEDKSLFMGSAGIGLFMSHLSQNGLKMSSILKPDISSKETFHDSELSRIDQNKIIESFAMRYFPRTTQSLDISKLDLPKKNEAISKKIIEYLEKQLSGTSEYIASFQLEKIKYLLHNKIESDSFLHISQQLEIEKNHKFLSTNSNISSLSLKLPESFRIVNGPQKNDQDENYLLLRPSHAGVSELPLTNFLHVLLTKFEHSINVTEVLNKIVEDFEENSETEKVKAFTIEQIKHAMKAGLLIQSLD